MSVFSNRFRSKEPGRFLRFTTVGASGTLIDFLLLSALKALGLPTLPANTLSYSAGTLNNFAWNRRWTFPEARNGHWKKQMAQFVLAGLVLNNALMQLLEPLFGVSLGYWGYLPTKGMATGVVVFWNYLANRFWTFWSDFAVEVQGYEHRPSGPGLPSVGLE